MFDPLSKMKDTDLLNKMKDTVKKLEELNASEKSAIYDKAVLDVVSYVLDCSSQISETSKTFGPEMEALAIHRASIMLDTAKMIDSKFLKGKR